MIYQGFARKYRPQTFDDVVGQEPIATTLKNAISTNRVHHAYLFCGSKGVGKTSMARILSKALNCEKGPTSTPCNNCEICNRITAGDDIDVIEIDGASNRGIDEIRNIKDNIKYSPARARYKIFIIDEVHMLTTQAFNALLKTLEEPPVYAKFILATTHPISIPDTILSRCQRFDFSRVRQSDVIHRLTQIAEKEKLVVDPTVLREIARITGGAMRDSLTLLDQLASFSEKDITKESLYMMLGQPLEEEISLLTESLVRRDIREALTITNEFIYKGGEVSELLSSFIEYLRKLMLIKIIGRDESFFDLTTEQMDRMEKQSKGFSIDSILLILQHLINISEKMRRSLVGRIMFEMALIKIFRIEDLAPITDITVQLALLEKNLTNALKSHSLPIQSLPPLPPVAEATRLDTAAAINISEQRVKSTISDTEERNKAPILTTYSSEKPQETSSNRRQQTAPVGDIKHQGVPDISLDKIWNGMLDHFREHNPREAELLRSEVKPKLEDKTLVLVFPPTQKYKMSVLSQPDKKKLFENILAENLGQKLSIGFALSENSQPLVKNKDLAAIVKEKPLTKKTIELFDGRILEVGQDLNTSFQEDESKTSTKEE